MQTLELLVTFFIVLWLHHMVLIAAQMKHLTADYREIHKVKKTFTSGSRSQNIFSKETLEVLQSQTDEVSFRMDHHSKRYTVAKDEWDKLQKEHVIPPLNLKFFPEYGVLFNDHGYLLPGLKKTCLWQSRSLKNDILKESSLIFLTVMNGLDEIFIIGKAPKETYQLLKNLSISKCVQMSMDNSVNSKLR